MADWTIPVGGQVESYLVNLWGSDLTCHASANTKGAYSNLTAATSIPIDTLIIYVTYTNDKTYRFLADIAIGAEGSEVIIVPNILITSDYSLRRGAVMNIPIHIPAGTRISARGQCTSASSKTFGLSAAGMRGGILYDVGGGLVSAYGVNTASTNGALVDGGASINTKGVYTELSPSCSNIRGFFVRFGNNANIALQWQHWNVDIAIGAAGQEVIIVPDIIVVGQNISSAIAPDTTIFYPIPIPAGTRLSARCLCSVNAADDRILNVVMYGVG